MRTIYLAAAITFAAMIEAPAMEYVPCDTRCESVVSGGQAPSKGRKASSRPRYTTIEQVKRSALVAYINARLDRYVRPTGRCGGQELLTTHYGRGDGFHGRKTANGERFNAYGRTAASMTLPIGTVLHLTNPHNGRSTTVRINDRGPVTRAKLDISWGAAQALGMMSSSYLCVSRGVFAAGQ